MSKYQRGPKNGGWRGGRSVASNGYVLIRVGVEHHLADVRGYAYEHRLVAEKKIGRRLLPGEQIHHKDGDKQNNSPDNLDVEVNAAVHRVKHRKNGSRRRLPGEDNQSRECRCGCGTVFECYDETGRPREYVSGHNPQPATTRDAILSLLSSAPTPRRDIIIRLGISKFAVATALSKLKHLGLVVNSQHGVWSVVGGRNG